MSDCKYTPTDVSLFLLHQMTPETTRCFQNHLEGCAKCQNCLHTLTQVEEIANQTEAVCRVKRRKQYMISIQVAATLLLCFGIGYLFYNQKQSFEYPQKSLEPALYLHTDSVNQTSDSLPPLEKTTQSPKEK